MSFQFLAVSQPNEKKQFRLCLAAGDDYDIVARKAYNFSSIFCFIFWRRYHLDLDLAEL